MKQKILKQAGKGGQYYKSSDCFEYPKTSLLKSNHPQSTCQISNPPKILELKISTTPPKKSFDHPCHLKSGEPCYNNNNIWAQLELTDALVSGHCIQTQASLVVAPWPAQAMQPITWVRHLKGKQSLLERKVGRILVNRPLH